MANRSINDMVTNINTIISAGISYPNNDFYGVAVLQTKDGKTFPLRRTDREEGKKISPMDTRGLQFYHRILSEKAEPIGGKGSAVYYQVTYQMVLVAFGWRKTTTANTIWNNEDIASEVASVMGESPSLAQKELVLTDGRSVTDKMTVLSQEFAGNTDINARVLDLLAFKIEYTIKQKRIGNTC